MASSAWHKVIGQLRTYTKYDNACPTWERACPVHILMHRAQGKLANCKIGDIMKRIWNRLSNGPPCFGSMNACNMLRHIDMINIIRQYSAWQLFYQSQYNVETLNQTNLILYLYSLKKLWRISDYRQSISIPSTYTLSFSANSTSL